MLFLILGICCLSPMSSHADLLVPVAVTQDLLNRHTALLDEKGLPVEKLTNLHSQYSTRAVADFVIMQQALYVSGEPIRFKFITVPNIAREREAVRGGQAVVTSTALFSSAMGDKVLQSSPVVSKGAFVKGVYGLKTNKELMAVKSLKELQSFDAVSSQDWKVDWMTLKKMQPYNLRNVPLAKMMVSLIASGRADYALFEFAANPDLSREENGHVLHPVPGIKVGLIDSRHFGVSKQHVNGMVVLDALEKGLSILRKRGAIEKYYHQVGFYNPAVEDWKLIFP